MIHVPLTQSAAEYGMKSTAMVTGLIAAAIPVGRWQTLAAIAAGRATAVHTQDGHK